MILERRISTGRVAQLLGCSHAHVRRLIECGVLDAVDVRLPGAPRPKWAVSFASVERFVAARAPAAEPQDRQALKVAAYTTVQLRRGVNSNK